MRARFLISIHALLAEGDHITGRWVSVTTYFYPRPPRGGRPGLKRQGYRDVLFLSTPSARRATLGLDNKVRNQLFLSTPSARRATRSQPSTHTGAEISIHALREEGDNHKETVDQDPIDFYPRPPRGGRPPLTSSAGRPSAFLSTPSARRATRHSEITERMSEISIHALREEGDDYIQQPDENTYEFLSTPSARRATCRSHCLRPVVLEISIHALREEGDSYHMRGQAADIIVFLSTPSARRATRSNDRGRSGHHHFYPRPPRGGRRYVVVQSVFSAPISIHALREEGDSIPGIERI